MTMTIKKALEELSKFNIGLVEFLESFKNNFSLDYDLDNPDLEFLNEKIVFLIESLELTSKDIIYLNSPIKSEGEFRLAFNKIFINGDEISDKVNLELFLDNKWYDSFINKKNNIFYFDGCPITEIMKNNNPLKARVRVYNYL